MMTRAEAIRETMDAVEDELIVSATGMISREVFTMGDRPENFYTIGSMGLVASIGLGLSLVRADRRVVVFDGDGSVLMALGTLAMVGERSPANFVHIVFDNEVYASTGNQRSISDAIALDEIARACGYPWVNRVESQEELRELAPAVLREQGPAFLLVKVQPGNLESVDRVTHPPEIIAELFREAIASVESS
jgi:phosphonopyruvate decarboxylase/sulfopyruvate decarboxylase subunit beta